VPLNMSDDVLQNIYFGTHQKLHPTSRPLNKELIISESKKLLEGILNKSVPFDEESEYTLEADNLKQIIKYFD